MKKTTLSKKLRINKTTIAALNNLEQLEVVGGIHTHPRACPTRYGVECPLTTIIGFNCEPTDPIIC